MVASLLSVSTHGGDRVRVQIRSIHYACIDQTTAGLCAVDGGRWWHAFRSNPPLWDERTAEIIGCVRVIGTGINDSDRNCPPSPASVTPHHLVGRMEKLVLVDGKNIHFQSHDLWTDTSGHTLFIRGRSNPTNEYHGIPLMNPKDLDAVIASKEVTAVYYHMSACKECARSAPHARRLGSHVRIVAFDAGEHAAVALKKGVGATPVIVIYRSGRRVTKIIDIKRVADRLDRCRTSILKA